MILIAQTEDPEFDPIRKAQEQAVEADYKKYLDNVMDLHAMTKTIAWRNFWQWLNESLKKSREEIEIAEKPRDVLYHQVTIRQLKAIKETFARPVSELNDYMNHNTLFVSQMPVRAEWNSQLGQVQIKKVA